MDASNKQPSTAEKFAAVWEKKNAKAARAGGVSLMALSLAACGSSSDTTTTSSTSTSTSTTTTVTPVTSSLSLANDTVTGTSGNDTITAARVDTLTTWNNGDTITGGEGTDSLTATISADVNPSTGAVSGVENVTVTALTNNATVTFSTSTADKITGVTSLTNLASTSNLTFTRVLDNAPVNITNASGETYVTFASLTGTADTLTLNLSGVTGTVGIGSAADPDGDFETIAITNSGAASDLGTGDGADGDTAHDLGADATSVTVNASAALDLGSKATFGKTTSFDASASTAGVTAVFADRASAGETAVTFTGGSGADNFDISAFSVANFGDIKLNMGDGNDTVDIGTVSFADSGTMVDGQGGTGDILVTSHSIDTTEGARIQGFEIMNFDTTGQTQDADFHDGTIFGTAQAIAALTVNDLASGSVFNANHSMSTGVTLNLKTNGATDAITINIGGTAGGADLNAANIDTNYETITINSQGTSANTLSSFGTAINNVIITGGTALTIDDIDDPTGVIDGSAMTAALNIGGTFTNGSTVKTSTKADNIDLDTLSGGETVTIYAGAGNDDIDAAATFVGGGTIYGEAGNDDINIATADPATAATDIITVNGGAGIDNITLRTTALDEQTVQSSATLAADADIVTGFDTGEDEFDYNGTLANGTATGVSTTSIADGSGTLNADVVTAMNSANTTHYFFVNHVSGTAATTLTTLADATVATFAAAEAAFVDALISELGGAITNLDATLGTSDSVLFTMENGADTVTMRVTNTDTSVANTLTAAEVEVVAVFDAEVLATGDFI